jgi:hypothetical protein
MKNDHCNKFPMEMDSLFVTPAAFILFVITMTNWKSSVTAILGVCNVNSTTSYSSSAYPTQSIRFIYAYTRERKDREKS